MLLFKEKDSVLTQKCAVCSDGLILWQHHRLAAIQGSGQLHCSLHLHSGKHGPGAA